MKILLRISVALAVGVLAACASNGEPEFGSSVRHMITGSAANPAAPVSTAQAPMDGERAGVAVKDYRTPKTGTAPSAASALVIPINQ